MVVISTKIQIFKKPVGRLLLLFKRKHKNEVFSEHERFFFRPFKNWFYYLKNFIYAKLWLTNYFTFIIKVLPKTAILKELLFNQEI